MRKGLEERRKEGRILLKKDRGEVFKYSNFNDEIDPQSFGFALTGLSDKKVLVNVRNDTSTGNGGLDEEIELFVTSDGELQMSGSNSPDFEVL